MFERSFSLCYFYCSHILAQLAIGNLILMVNVYDAAHTRYRDQVAKLEKYSHFRNLPSELKDRIKSYYEHQWKILNGMNEQELLEQLPHNINIKVRQATVRDHLKAVPVLKLLRVAVLNALVEDVKTFIYSPRDVIVSAGSQAMGMHIVLRGEAFITLSTDSNATSTSTDATDAQEEDLKIEKEVDEDAQIPQSTSKTKVGAEPILAPSLHTPMKNKVLPGASPPEASPVSPASGAPFTPNKVMSTIGAIGRSLSFSPQLGSEHNIHAPMESGQFQGVQKRRGSLSRLVSFGSNRPPAPMIITKTLGQGEVFGPNGLTTSYTYAATLSSGASVCEVLFLSRARFRRTCRLHMSEMELDELLSDQNKRDAHRKSLSYPSVDKKKVLKEDDVSSDKEDANAPIPHSSVSSSPTAVAKYLPPSGKYTRKKGRNVGVLSNANAPSNSGAVYHHQLPSGGVIQVNEAEENLPWYLSKKSFDPESTPRACWDALILFCLLHYSFTLPVLFAHTFDPDVMKNEFYLLISSWVLDCILIIDLILRAFYFNFHRDSVIYKERWEIWRNFLNDGNIPIDSAAVLRSRRIVLIRESVAVIPLDLLAFVFGTRALALLRVGKFIQLRRILEYFYKLGRSLEVGTFKGIHFELGFETARFFRLYVALLLVSVFCSISEVKFLFLFEFVHVAVPLGRLLFSTSCRCEY